VSVSCSKSAEKSVVMCN